MPVVPLQCPHCTGPLQVDLASAGQQVLCPHCQGPLVVPPEEILAQLWAAASGMPPPAPPSPPANGEAVTLACPVCSGPFQVLPAMSGQQLGCPHCGSPITIPPLAPPNVAGPSPQGFAEDDAPAPILPPGVGDVADATAYLPPPVQPPAVAPEPAGDVVPRSFTDRKATRSAAPSEDRYPPGFVPPKASRTTETVPPERRPDPPASVDRYPPGMQPSGQRPPLTDPSFRDPPRSEPSRPASRDANERSPPPSRPAIDDLLPPGASAPATPEPAPPPPVVPNVERAAAAPPIDDLLPPGASTSPTASPPFPAAPAHQPSLLDALLPPGAAESESAPAGAQVAIPKAPKKLPVVPGNLPAGAIAVPTPEGGFVTVRETPKTIGRGDEAIEVRRLTPEEKARRRLRNNLIIGGFCLAVIVIVVVVLMW
jgi:uncharacterized protein YbaR (Trm112 family)